MLKGGIKKKKEGFREIGCHRLGRGKKGLCLKAAWTDKVAERNKGNSNEGDTIGAFQVEESTKREKGEVGINFSSRSALT